jgi:hypothetical protein
MPKSKTLTTTAATNTDMNDVPDAIRTKAAEDVYALHLQVPIGCVPIFQRWCSDDFAIHILKGPPTRPVKYPGVKFWQPEQGQFFAFLEDRYAHKLWNAMERKSDRGARELHFNFEKRDFDDAGFETPAQACTLFLNELTRDDRAGACPATNGKFYGMTYNVWNNASFTTVFTW